MTTPSLQFCSIHGHRRAFRMAGSGPALLLLHGIGEDSMTWHGVHSALAQRFTVIAPDFLGYGESDKPRADYSLAALANDMRDLLDVLDIDRVTIVGHSLGGGVATQFAYQYPHLVERLVLVGSVTKNVSPALWLASLPMGSEALALLRVPGVLRAVQFVGNVAAKSLGRSTKLGRDLPEALNILARLKDPAALSAFSRTLRALTGGHGQSATMLDRSYPIPVQLIWGEDDLMIPVSHAHSAHAEIPGSRLEIFENSGHLPYHDHPERFVEIVEQFIDSTPDALWGRRAIPIEEQEPEPEPLRVDEPMAVA